MIRCMPENECYFKIRLYIEKVVRNKSIVEYLRKHMLNFHLNQMKTTHSHFESKSGKNYALVTIVIKWRQLLQS